MSNAGKSFAQIRRETQQKYPSAYASKVRLRRSIRGVDPYTGYRTETGQLTDAQRREIAQAKAEAEGGSQSAEQTTEQGVDVTVLTNTPAPINVTENVTTISGTPKGKEYLLGLRVDASGTPYQQSPSTSNLNQGLAIVEQTLARNEQQRLENEKKKISPKEFISLFNVKRAYTGVTTKSGKEDLKTGSKIIASQIAEDVGIDPNYQSPYTEPFFSVEGQKQRLRGAGSAIRYTVGGGESAIVKKADTFIGSFTKSLISDIKKGEKGDVVTAYQTASQEAGQVIPEPKPSNALFKQESTAGRLIDFTVENPYLVAGVGAGAVASGSVGVANLLKGTAITTGVGVTTAKAVPQVIYYGATATPAGKEKYAKYLTAEYDDEYRRIVEAGEAKTGVIGRVGSELFGSAFATGANIGQLKTLYGGKVELNEAGKASRAEAYRIGREELGLEGQELKNFVQAMSIRTLGQSVGQVSALTAISVSSEVLGRQFVAKEFAKGGVAKSGTQVFTRTAPRIAEAGFGEGFASQIIADISKSRPVDIKSATVGGLAGYGSAGLIGGKIAEYQVTKSGKLKPLEFFAYTTDPYEKLGDELAEIGTLQFAKQTGQKIIVPAITPVTVTPTSVTKTSKPTTTYAFTTTDLIDSSFTATKTSSKERTGSRSDAFSFTKTKSNVPTPTEELAEQLFGSKKTSTPSDVPVPEDTPVPVPEPTPVPITEDIFAPTFITTPTTVPTPTTTPTSVPITILTPQIRIPAIPFIPRDSLAGKGKSRARTRSQKKGYSPSLSALAFGITSTKRSKLGEISGLGLRPIIVPERKKKKKVRKK